MRLGDMIHWHGHVGEIVVFPVATVGIACEARFLNGYVQRFRSIDLVPLSPGVWRVKDRFDPNVRNNEMW